MSNDSRCFLSLQIFGAIVSDFQMGYTVPIQILVIMAWKQRKATQEILGSSDSSAMRGQKQTFPYFSSNHQIYFWICAGCWYCNSGVMISAPFFRFDWLLSLFTPAMVHQDTKFWNLGQTCQICQMNAAFEKLQGNLLTPLYRILQRLSDSDEHFLLSTFTS